MDFILAASQYFFKILSLPIVWMEWSFPNWICGLGNVNDWFITLLHCFASPVKCCITNCIYVKNAIMSSFIFNMKIIVKSMTFGYLNRCNVHVYLIWNELFSLISWLIEFAWYNSSEAWLYSWSINTAKKKLMAVSLISHGEFRIIFIFLWRRHVTNIPKMRRV